MATSLGGWFDKVFFDAHGEPCASGELRFYQTGTDIPQGVATFDGTPLGAVVRLDTVTVSAASPATLTLVGDFTLGPDGLTVVIAGGRQLRAGFKLLDIADATFLFDGGYKALTREDVIDILKDSLACGT